MLYSISGVYEHTQTLAQTHTHWHEQKFELNSGAERDREWMQSTAEDRTEGRKNTAGYRR